MKVSISDTTNVPEKRCAREAYHILTVARWGGGGGGGGGGRCDAPQLEFNLHVRRIRMQFSWGPEVWSSSVTCSLI